MQLTTCLADCNTHGIINGELSCENVYLTVIDGETIIKVNYMTSSRVFSDFKQGEFDSLSVGIILYQMASPTWIKSAGIDDFKPLEDN